MFPLLQVRWWQCRWQEFQGDQTLHLLSAEIQAPLPPGAGRISPEEMPAHAPESLAAGGQQRAGAHGAAPAGTPQGYLCLYQVRAALWLQEPGAGPGERWAEHPAAARMDSGNVGMHKAEKTWHTNACQWSKINVAYEVFREDRPSSALCFKMWMFCSAVSGPKDLVFYYAGRRCAVWSVVHYLNSDFVFQTTFFEKSVPPLNYLPSKSNLSSCFLLDLTQSNIK